MGNSFRLKEGRIRLKIKKKIYNKEDETLEQVAQINVINTASLDIFIARSDGPLSNPIQLQVSLSWTR